jgi:hypothetical protein
LTGTEILGFVLILQNETRLRAAHAGLPDAMQAMIASTMD